MNAPVTGHRPASQPLAGLLLGLLTALLLLTLALPLLNPVSWLGRAAPLILGPADQPIATLNRYSLLYKSDNRGFYLVVRSQWQLLKPLQEGDKVRVELLNDKGVRIDQLSQAVDKRQKCRKERCTLSLNSALRAPDDALDSRYQLRIGLLLADRPESAEYSQILQTLPERGFNLLYLMTSLLLVLLVSAAVLKALLPRLRRSYRARVAGSLLLGNLTFVLLHGFVVFKLGEFLFWSGFRPEHYYLAWGSMVLGWSLCALAGFSLYMGLLFTALSGIGLLANFMKIAIYGVPLGGDDLGNLLALLHILLDQHPVVPVLVVLGLLFLVWRFALSRWILRGLLRTTAATAAFFALCVFATQTGNKLLGANIRYVDRAVNYHRDIIRAGPGLYLFNLVDEMLQSGNVFRYPLQINERTPELSLPAQPRAPSFDLVIVLQYESLWLDWQGRLCAPAPTLSLPASVAQWRKTIHSPTTGGMTVLAEFEMNTGLPAGLLKQDPQLRIGVGGADMRQDRPLTSMFTHDLHRDRALYLPRAVFARGRFDERDLVHDVALLRDLRNSPPRRGPLPALPEADGNQAPGASADAPGAPAPRASAHRPPLPVRRPTPPPRAGGAAPTPAPTPALPPKPPSARRPGPLPRPPDAPTTAAPPWEAAPKPPQPGPLGNGGRSLQPVTSPRSDSGSPGPR